MSKKSDIQKDKNHSSILPSPQTAEQMLQQPAAEPIKESEQGMCQGSRPRPRCQH